MIGLFILLNHYYSKKNRILREMKKSRTVPVHRAQEGAYVKMTGRAKYVEEPFDAPISGRKCIYYHVLVERKGNKSWHTVVDEKKYQDFFLEVGEEMAIVKANLVNNERLVYLEKDYRTSSGFLNDAPARLNRYLESHGKSSTGFLGFNKTIRYREGIIAPNEQVAVKGIARWKSLQEPIEGFSYSKILTLTGTMENKLLITDHAKTRSAHSQ